MLNTKHYLTLLLFRENSFSPDFEDFEYAGGYPRRGGRKFDDEFGASDDSGHGRSTEMSGTNIDITLINHDDKKISFLEPYDVWEISGFYCKI